MGEYLDRGLHEECGVFGVYRQTDAAHLTYFGLHALQHRGQEGAGIATADGKSIHCHKGKGLLTEVFGPADLEGLKGKNAIGHVRYGTAGGGELANVQPLVARKANESALAVAHNGQIVNAAELRQELEDKGSIFWGTSDSEIILHLLQGEQGSLLEKIKKACRRLDGAFAFLILTEKNLYAIRDKNGLRPLSLAKQGDGWCVSSESCAFDIVGAQLVRDVKPGEIVKLSSDGIESFSYTEETSQNLCAMEYIYFSRPDSVLEGQNVHGVRRACGRLLAQEDLSNFLQADIVVGVPDSSLSAAAGYSEAMGLPNEMGLIKNRYVGRTFIQPTQAQRDLGVKLKLSANVPVVRGKRVVLVDDSIVRGTTSKRIVALLRQAGATEVHLRIAAPAIKFPCFYGVDMSTRAELASASLEPDILARVLGADSLRFISLENLKQACGTEGLCTACFSGEYSTPLYSHTL
ncbi:amidophosphoribosyltransferase [uncultured Allofournierella sp.]|uniref:amidophosphoribosyltransferase n=1 Tax=uncultured Allofournierella sp. TaxID=1940258 RepID=UPI0037518F2A